MTQKHTLIAGAILGLLGVAIGAFGAHALKQTLTAYGRVDTFELAVRYQFYHAFALLTLGILMGPQASTVYSWAAILFTGGVLLFSGSLYLLAVLNQTSFAMVTPIGGLLLLGGWICMLIGLFRR